MDPDYIHTVHLSSLLQKLKLPAFWRPGSTTVEAGTGAPAPVEATVTPSPQESRSIENPANAVTSANVAAWDAFGSWGLGEMSAGVVVNSETALRFGAVYSAINIIAETIATLPCKPYITIEGGTEPAKDHPIYPLFMSEPNELQTWFTFWHSMLNVCLRYGNAYALIVRDGAGRPIELMFLEPGDCSPQYLKVGRQRMLYYYVDGILTEKRDVLHISCLGSDGVIGKSPIALHAEGIGLAIAAEEFGARFYGKGMNMAGAFVTPDSLKDDSYKRLHKQLKEKYAGLKNSHETMLLEGGLTYQRFGIPPAEAQYIENRKFQVEEIGRLYRVPLHKLASMESSTNNNIEQQTIDFVNDCVVPWAERIEQELKRKLYLPHQKLTHGFNFDVDYLLRGNPVARSQYYLNRFNTGSITSNEIRNKEKENKMANPLMDTPFVQSGFQPLREQNFTPDNANPTNQEPPKEAPQK